MKTDSGTSSKDRSSLISIGTKEQDYKAPRKAVIEVMDPNLSRLARTLAERLVLILWPPITDVEKYRRQISQAETVIREAIEKTLEAAIEQCDDYVLGTDGDGFKEAVEQCMEAIRSLKQSNSGAEASR
jgi:hypothetical protein